MEEGFEWKRQSTRDALGTAIRKRAEDEKDLEVFPCLVKNLKMAAANTH
jgi:hypothetical protein